MYLGRSRFQTILLSPPDNILSCENESSSPHLDHGTLVLLDFPGPRSYHKWDADDKPGFLRRLCTFKRVTLTPNTKINGSRSRRLGQSAPRRSPLKKVTPNFDHSQSWALAAQKELRICIGIASSFVVLRFLQSLSSGKFDWTLSI